MAGFFYKKRLSIGLASPLLAMVLLLGLSACEGLGRSDAPLSPNPGSLVGSAAEWYPARHILMHTPGDELFLGVLHPDAALFEKTFSIDGAAAEHQAYIRALEDRGVEVTRVVDTLLAGTLDDHGKVIEADALQELRDFAGGFVTLDLSRLSAAEASAQVAYLDLAVGQLHPHELVKVILQQPRIRLKKTSTNTGYAADYELKPQTNLYFSRDQLITTGKGVVIGKMSAPQRASETEIIKFVLDKLGIEPIAEIQDEGTLEGGDFIPAGQAVFIGQGLRTNAEAIRQLFDAEVFDSDRVVVVKDYWQDQEQMHLDTFFNIINPKLGVLVESRVESADRKPDEKMRLTVDIYERRPGGRYELAIRDADFQSFVTRDLGMTLIPVPVDDQLKYGVNFLTVSANEIIAVDGVSQGYKDQLKRAGVDATWIDFRNMTGGYGAAHCVTQVLRRDPVPVLGSMRP
jgi:arginine deiminase